jgi:methionine synthase II (cobalamin-independent)
VSDAIATSLVGSYPQPDWLVDREALNQRLPPRLRAREDCGMKYLPREAAFAKLEAMVASAGAAVRS